MILMRCVVLTITRSHMYEKTEELQEMRLFSYSGSNLSCIVKYMNLVLIPLSFTNSIQFINNGMIND